MQLDSGSPQLVVQRCAGRVNFAIKEAKVQVGVEQNPGHRKPTGEIVLKMTIDEKVTGIKEIVSSRLVRRFVPRLWKELP